MKKLELKDIIFLIIVISTFGCIVLTFIVSELDEIIDEQQKVIEIQKRIIKLHEYHEELPSITNLDINQA